jgi:hypothetical protein
MVFVLGLTLCVPPVAASVWLVESTLLVMTTATEFVAVTVNVLDCPAGIEAGIALMVTVGGPAGAVTVTVAWAVAVLPPLAVTVMV